MTTTIALCWAILCLFLCHQVGNVLAVNSEVLQLTRHLYRSAYDYPLANNRLRMLHRLANQIREIQNNNQSEWRLSEAQREANLPTFAKWANSHLQLDGLQFLTTPEAGMAVYATKDLDRNDIILRGTMNYTLSRTDSKLLLKDCIQEDKIMALRGHYEDYWVDNLWAALRLIVERLRKDSIFTPYIDCLPYDFVHPLFFNEDDFYALSGSIAHTNAIGMLEDVFLQYAAIFEQLIANSGACALVGLTPDTLTLEKYMWAVANTLTRAFLDDNGADLRLMPVRDMMNHELDAEMETFKTTGYSSESMFTITASKPVKKGAELLYEYNSKSSTLDLFLNSWGMIIPEASFYVRATLYPIEENYEVKLKLLTRSGFSTSKYLKFNPHLQPIPFEEKDFLFLVIVSTGLSDSKDLSESTWKKCWNFLISTIKDQLAVFPQTLEESKKLRDTNKNLNSNTRLALNYIITEKEALYKAMKTAQSLADNFSDLKKDEL